jgi:hypothetical protein
VSRADGIRGGNDRFPLVVIAGLLLLAGLGAFLFRGAERSDFADKLSTYRAQPDGARALYLLAEESGLPVSRLKRDLELIEAGDQLVVLGVGDSKPLFDLDALIGDGGTPGADAGFPVADDTPVEEEDDGRKVSRHLLALSKDERTAVLGHVASGATLIYVPLHSPDPLLEELGVRPWSTEDAVLIRTLVPAQPSPFTSGVDRVEARVKHFLELPPQAVPLLQDERFGHAVAAWVPHQKGQLIVLGAPELATNAAIGRADNAQLWLSLLGTVARAGPVRFDEFHHGFTADRSAAEFAKRYGLHYALAQLMLGLVFWAAALRRFGRPLPPPEEARVGSADALFAAGRLYREGRHRGHAAMLLSRGLAQAIAPQVGLRWTATPPEVAHACRARGRKDLAAAIEGVHDAALKVRSDADVLHVARLAAAARKRQ